MASILECHWFRFIKFAVQLQKKVEMDADISGNIMAFLWKQRSFTLSAATLDLSKFIGDGQSKHKLSHRL